MRWSFAPAIAFSLMCFALPEGADAGQRPGVALPNLALSQLAPGGSPTLPSKPFSTLFQPSTPPAAPLRGPARSTAPRVACGMTLVPVDPAFDARIRRKAPDKPKPSSKSVPTPKCD